MIKLSHISIIINKYMSIITEMQVFISQICPLSHPNQPNSQPRGKWICSSSASPTVHISNQKTLLSPYPARPLSEPAHRQTNLWDCSAYQCPSLALKTPFIVPSINSFCLPTTSMSTNTMYEEGNPGVLSVPGIFQHKEIHVTYRWDCSLITHSSIIFCLTHVSQTKLMLNILH